MRRLSFSLSLCLLVLLTGLPAFAGPPSPAGTPVAKGPAAKRPQHPVEIVTDDKTGVLRVLIGGKEVFAIDAKGVHVKGDVTYSGVSVDQGDSIKLP
jgi:hypothetical protein